MFIGNKNSLWANKNDLGHTFIGGIGATTNTPQLLSDLLQIDVSRINNFIITNNDIDCYIFSEYEIPHLAFFNNTEITSYWDYDGKVTTMGINTGSGTFENTPSLTHIYMPNCEGIPTRCFALGGLAKEVIYLPRCTQIGLSPINQFIFWYGSFNNCILYVDPINETSNGGGLEGDIAYNQTYSLYKLKDYRFVTNYISPEPINDLVAVNIYDISIKISWSTPLSTNAIDYYEVYANGVLHTTTEDTELLIIGLTNLESYDFTVKTIDVFYNYSGHSNVLTQTINGNSQFPLTDIISEYKFEDNVLDTVGSNDGTPTDMTYVTNMVDRAGYFNGSSSKIFLQDADNLSFGNGVSDVPFSITFLFSLDTTNQSMFVSKSQSVANREYYIFYTGYEIRVRLFGNASGSIYKTYNYEFAPVISKTYHLTVTYDGTDVKIYIDGLLILAPLVETGSYVAMDNREALPSIGCFNDASPTIFLEGQMDCVRWWNLELTPDQAFGMSKNELAGIDINP